MDGSALHERNLRLELREGHNHGVARVEVWLGTTRRCSDTSSPYGCSFTAPTTAGDYPLTAKAFDRAGNVNTTPSRVLRVR